MGHGVIIDMNNKNVLVALAYIKANDNPLKVFCNYALYILLSTPEHKLRVDELHDKIFEKFGLDMPQQMLNVCMRLLRKDGNIEYLPNGAGYHAINTPFSVEEFDKNFLRLHEQEDRVLKDLMEYVGTNHKQKWTLEQAKGYLSVFLNEQGNGANLFLGEDISIPDSVTPSWYIGRYIQSISQQPDSLEWQYLVEIINGLMIYQGVYQTNDYEQDRTQKFRNTCFFLDTKLVLRAMGYSWSAQVQAANELVQLITNEYGGKICVFEQTVTEVGNALAAAGSAYDKGLRINNSELRVYAELNPVGATLLSERSESVRAWIEKSASFHIEERIDWSSEQNQRHNLDCNSLIEHISSKHPLWRLGTINNDVAVINQINILRKSDYSQRFGGRQRLPVFVTTNTELVYSVRDYAQNQSELDKRTSWNPHALPIVSDNMILFRLWVPVASKYTKLPALTLSRYAYNAQNVNSQFFEVLRQKTQDYQSQHDVDLINLSDARRRKLEDIIVAATDGEADNITEPVIAMSVDELVRLENSSLSDELHEAKQSGMEKDITIAVQGKKIIELAARPHYNKLGLLKVAIYLAKYWWIIAAIVLYLGAGAISDLTVKNALIKWICGALPLAFEVVAFAFGKGLSDEKLDCWLLKPTIRWSVRKYSSKIRRSIKDDELVYADSIILSCLDNTKLLSKYKPFWPVEYKTAVSASLD